MSQIAEGLDLASLECHRYHKVPCKDVTVPGTGRSRSREIMSVKDSRRSRSREIMSFMGSRRSLPRT